MRTRGTRDKEGEGEGRVGEEPDNGHDPGPAPWTISGARGSALSPSLHR